MKDDLYSENRFLESENLLLKQQIRKKNAIIKYYIKKIKLLECGLKSYDSDFIVNKLNIFDFLEKKV